MAKVTNPGVKALIEKCIANVSDRLPAKDLLRDPFLLADDDHERITRHLKNKTQHTGKFKKIHLAQSKNSGIVTYCFFTGHMPMTEEKREQLHIDRCTDDTSAETTRDFSMHGQRKDVNKIFLKLRIADALGKIHISLSFPSSSFNFFRRIATLLEFPVFRLQVLQLF